MHIHTSIQKFLSVRISKLKYFAITGLMLSSIFAGLPQVAFADTAPTSGTPSTVSIDPLPTVQVNGIVWAQVTVGNTVYATGRFTSARPAGSPLGSNEVVRGNLLAYDIRTGVLKTDFSHSLGGTGTVEGRAIAASPDGKRLYVGGKFSTVNGQPRGNIAAFDLLTNTLVNGFTLGTNTTVRSVAATNTRVYFGGNFTVAGGQSHIRLAAYEYNGSIVTGWTPGVSVTGGPQAAVVSAMIIIPSENTLVFGGYFNRLNQYLFNSTGVVKLDTGAVVNWASQDPNYRIRLQLKPTAVSGNSASVTSLSTDGNQIYLTAYNFSGTNGDGGFEGRAALNKSNGAIIWANDCRGDSYSAFPIGQVLYSANHSHDCGPINAFPEVNPRVSQRALAETTYATGVNTAGAAPDYYPSYAGVPRGTQLNWYPKLNTANVSGSNQAAWSVTGNAQYVSLGGEFTLAENIPQQGLVRYAISSQSPNKYGPTGYAKYGVAVQAVADANGRAPITYQTTSDRDSNLLNYQIFRNGGTTPIFNTTLRTDYWNTPAYTIYDTGLVPGSINRYRMVVTDSFGNQTTTYSLFDDNHPSIVYAGSSWIYAAGRGYGNFGDAVHYTTSNTDTATFTFTGNNIGVVMEKYIDRGDISFSVDGAAPTIVNIYSATHKVQQTVYTKSGLSNNTHTITVKKVSGVHLDIDGFLVK